MAASDPVIRDAPLAEIDPVTLYRILAVRVDVFVVEQQCPYPDLDGLDLAPSTRLVWAEAQGEVLATLRVLWQADGSARIGRVATRADARGRGLAAGLMRHALALTGAAEVRLHAQSYLADWYAGFGFVRDGDEFLDDGIPHVPMRRTPLTVQG